MLAVDQLMVEVVAVATSVKFTVAAQSVYPADGDVVMVVDQPDGTGVKELLDHV